VISIIRQKDKQYSMQQFYEVIGYSRQAFAQMQKRNWHEEARTAEILNLVNMYRKDHPRMGSRQLYYTIKNIGGYDIGIGVNKFESLLSNCGMTISKPSKKLVKTSDGLGKESYPNLASGISLNDINQLIVGDITYYQLEGQMSYIFTLKDVYSQRILGIVPTLTMTADYGLKCLREAIKMRTNYSLNGCIHHTDNGSQYNANIYKACLADAGIIISRASNCLENGSAENLNSLIKNDYLIPWQVRSFNHLKESCKELQDINNNNRAINELSNLSSTQFEKVIENMKPEDRPIKKLFKFDI
jgi:putative transposase